MNYLRVVEKINSNLATLKEEEQKLRSDWEKEKRINNLIKEKKSEIEKNKFKLENAENNYDLELAAKLRHGVIPKL